VYKLVKIIILTYSNEFFKKIKIFLSKQQISVANFLIHESFCLRNIQLCNLCQKPMNKNLKEEHFKKFHEKSIKTFYLIFVALIIL
jgi:hypothetical protein